MTHQTTERSNVWRVAIAIILLAFGASHGVTGLLANIGWYESIGIDFDAWYMHPAYQSMCWFANGIALTMLIPLGWRTIKQASACNNSERRETAIDRNHL